MTALANERSLQDIFLLMIIVHSMCQLLTTTITNFSI